MNIDQLFALGAYTCAGNIDFRNVKIGELTPDGPVLTPEGEAMMAAEAAKQPLEKQRGRPRTVVASAAGTVSVGKE